MAEVAEAESKAVDKEAMELPEGEEKAAEVEFDVRGKGRKGRAIRIKKAIKDKKLMKVTEIPPLASSEIAEVYFQDVWPPYAFVRVTMVKKTHEYTYEVIEPKMTKEEDELLKFVIETIIEDIDFSREETESDEENQAKLRVIMNDILNKTGKEITTQTREKIFYYVIRSLMGYGKINVMMTDPMLEDISCDGVKLPLYVFHREFKNIKTNVRFDEHVELDSFVINLAQKSGKSISIAEPVLDATLPDGSRLNQTLGTEVTTRGSSFTIRKFKEDPLTISDLVKSHTLSDQMAAHLWLAVQFGESMICSGGTASGKTTTLNAISHFIPPSAKIITIEDTREMNLPHENWVAGLTREKKGEESGQSIDMFALLTAALRQRPEYMIVGEVRGKETMAVFQAMATGQITYSTIHADSVPSIVHRLENPPINIPRILILGLNLILLQAQVRVKGQRTRRIKEMVEVIGIEPTSNEIITNTVYKWLPAKDEYKYGGHSKLYEKIMERENLTAEEVLDEVDRRAKIIIWMMKKKLRRHTEVASVINEYYRDPKAVIERATKELGEIEAAEAEAAE
ncbi:type II/IV secretion system ATPase subunit [[Eubacterium] cellulosolvens]